MPPARSKLLLAAISTAVGVVVAIAVLRRPPVDTIRLENRTPAAYALLERRSREPALPFARLPGETARELIPEDVAQLLLSIDPRWMRYDPQTYYRYKGGQVIPGPDPAFLGTTFDLRVSPDGYREDFERLPERRDRFVLVTGDSNTDGICSNDLSFANLLEKRLGARAPGQAIEVLNAGVIGYSFYNYLGVLERHLELAPQAFIVAFFSGNDFVDVVSLRHYFQRTLPPKHDRAYWDRLAKFGTGNGSLLGNLLSQAYYFREYPAQAEIALQAAKEVCREIQRQCREHEIALVFVHIPFGGADDERFAASLESARDTLGTTAEDLERCRGLARALIADLRASGANVVDLEGELASDSPRYYWRDLHIDLAAHELVAERLEPLVAAILEL